MPAAKPKPKPATPPAPQPPPARFVRAAVAAVVVEDGKILMGRRRGARGAGQLAVPGGQPEHGEDLMAAVEREVLEETGLVVKALPYSKIQPELFLVNHVPPDDGDHYLVAFVEARVVGGKLANREPDKCAGWEWFTLTQLAQNVPQEAVRAWQTGGSHEALCWVPLPHLSYYREHLGLT